MHCIDILLQALVRSAKPGGKPGGKGKQSIDLMALVAVAEDLLGNEVCMRCLLRVFGHTSWEDYCMEPSTEDRNTLSKSLRDVALKHIGDQGIQLPTEETVELMQVVASELVVEGSRAPGQCRLCLGLLQYLGTGNEFTWDPNLGSAMEDHIDIPDMSPQVLAHMLKGTSQTSSLKLDVVAPLSATLRERCLSELLSHRYGKVWSADIIPLAMVLKHAVGLLLSRHLGPPDRICIESNKKKHYPGKDKGPDVDLTIMITLDHPDTLKELRPLAEDHFKFLNKKKQQPQSKKQRLTNESNKGASVVRDGEAAAINGASAVREGGASTIGPSCGHEAGSIQPSHELDMAAFRKKDALYQIQGAPGHIFRRLYPWPSAATSATTKCTVKALLIRAPLLLAGRYLKLKRGMPQSKWIDPETGIRIGTISLAERIEETLLPLYGGSESKFVSGGREDADVRMLGEGRPFVIEIIRPSKNHPSKEELTQAEAHLASQEHGARAIGLMPCSSKSLDMIKDAEESKEKTYRVLCWAERALTSEDQARLLSIKELQAQQDTPLRVLHRRAPKVRVKRVSFEVVEIVPLKPNYFNLQLRTQAGTYVKEFIHGDLGRTQPNLGTLLTCRTEMIQLDVMAVHMN